MPDSELVKRGSMPRLPQMRRMPRPAARAHGAGLDRHAGTRRGWFRSRFHIVRDPLPLDVQLVVTVGHTVNQVAFGVGDAAVAGIIDALAWIAQVLLAGRLDQVPAALFLWVGFGDCPGFPPRPRSACASHACPHTPAASLPVRRMGGWRRTPAWVGAGCSFAVGTGGLRPLDGTLAGGAGGAGGWAPFPLEPDVAAPSVGSGGASLGMLALLSHSSSGGTFPASETVGLDARAGDSSNSSARLGVTRPRRSPTSRPGMPKSPPPFTNVSRLSTDPVRALRDRFPGWPYNWLLAHLSLRGVVRLHDAGRKSPLDPVHHLDQAGILALLRQPAHVSRRDVPFVRDLGSFLVLAVLRPG